MQPMSNVQAPPACKTMADTGLNPVMMRDILLKTMFRMNLEMVSDLERVLAVPSRVVQDLIDDARGQAMVEAMGTMHATAGSEMGEVCISRSADRRRNRFDNAMGSPCG